MHVSDQSIANDCLINEPLRVKSSKIRLFYLCNGNNQGVVLRKQNMKVPTTESQKGCG